MTRRSTNNAAIASLAAVLVLALAVVPGAQPAARVAPIPFAPPVRVVVAPKRLGTIDPGLFGANLLWPYDAEGAYDPTSGQFYPQFVDEVRTLGITALRYPAGITSDSFQWERAIGPQDKRLANEPYGMQAAFRSKMCCTLDGPVPSTVGPVEFGDLLDQTGVSGTITVNFVTGNATQAADFVAFMTAPQSPRPSRSPARPSFWAALRARDGHPAPFDVPYWEVGNEQNGPGQYGWRSGTLVDVGPHRGPCPAWEAPTCLYAFGGTTAFYEEPMGTFADEEPSATFSTGRPNQSFYAYFPPVVPRSEVVRAQGHIWSPVRRLARYGPRAHVYAFTPSDGRVVFGNGRHGAVPPRGDRVTISYQSGPHGGFVEFYAAMKKMNPHIHICEAEESDTLFLQLMGRAYPYDCVELHEYAKPLDVQAPMTAYEESLLGAPLAEGAAVGDLQAAIRLWSGRNIPVVLTEYGQLVTPMPLADPSFNLSLDEGLLVGAQLAQWIGHSLPLAEKYLLNSAPFLDIAPVTTSMDTIGLSVDSSMIAGPGPPFLLEPTGLVMELMSHLAGGQRLRSTVVGDPVMEPGPDEKVPVLQVVAASLAGQLDIVVVNASPIAPVKTRVDLTGLAHGRYMTSSVLDGPGPLAYNTYYRPDAVKITYVSSRVPLDRNFFWTFPAHSVSLLELATPGP